MSKSNLTELSELTIGEINCEYPIPIDIVSQIQKIIDKNKPVQRDVSTIQIHGLSGLIHLEEIIRTRMLGTNPDLMFTIGTQHNKLYLIILNKGARIECEFKLELSVNSWCWPDIYAVLDDNRRIILSDTHTTQSYYSKDEWFGKRVNNIVRKMLNKDNKDFTDDGAIGFGYHIVPLAPSKCILKDL